MTTTFSVLRSSKFCSRSSKFNAMLPVQPKQREPEIQFDDYTQTDMSRGLKWPWFLSSSRMGLDDPDYHGESDHLVLCHKNEEGDIEGKGHVVWIDFVCEKGYSVRKPSECGYVEVLVDDEYEGKIDYWTYVMSSELFLKTRPMNFKELYGEPLAMALAARNSKFPSNKVGMAAWLVKEGAFK